MADHRLEEFDKFIEQCHLALGQQVSGHTAPFQDLWSRGVDVVLMGAAGSHAVGWEEVSASLTWASAHLDFTGWRAENLTTSVNDRLAFTVELEHMTHEVNGELQGRTLRVSQGYRFEDDHWRVVFRHGDPMAERVAPTASAGYP